MKNEAGHRSIDKGLSKLGEVEGVNGTNVFPNTKILVVEKQGGIKEECYYIGNYEIYKIIGSLDNHERNTVKLTDDTKVFALLEKRTGENAVIRYQYDNHLGSACLELDANANIISYEEYHPFGTTSYRAGRSQTEVSLKRYKYCGKERDEETGLYYYGARYYASWLCRFVSVDPLQHEYPHYTPYQYAGNKPITYIDLDGQEPAKVDDDPPKNRDNTLRPADTIPDDECVEEIQELSFENNPVEYLNSLGIDIICADTDQIILTGDYIDFGNGNIHQTFGEVLIEEPRERTDTPWLDVAFKEHSDEITAQNNPERIVEYLRSTSLGPNHNGYLAWCAAFVNWSLKEAGIDGANSPGVSAWKNWGTKLDNPAYGAIAIWKDGSHVGFVVGENAEGKLVMLHGNWSKKVDLSTYGIDKSEIGSYVYPTGYKPNFNLQKY
jgi:uncharacterized protein (TIGR02594 family)